MKWTYRFFPIILFLVVLQVNVYGDSDEDGDGNTGGPGAPPKKDQPNAGDPLDPYTGNDHREVRDLEIWGSMGQIPMVWMRYGNSRSGNGNFKYLFGNAHNWNHGFKFDMSDQGVDSLGRAQIQINNPDGNGYLFTQDASNPSNWLSQPGVPEMLFQNGLWFTLQVDNGNRYHFEKVANNQGVYIYLLRDILDNTQNTFRLTYNGQNNIDSIIEPAGRYFSLSYSKIGGAQCITQVKTSDGRSVNYVYTTVNDGVDSWTELTSVNYGDGTQATYTYTQSQPGNRPLVGHAIDPRCAGIQPNMIFSYSSKVQGVISQEINGVTSDVMASLTINYDDGTMLVCYPNGRVQNYHMPDKMHGNLKDYTDGIGRVTQYTHDNNGAGFLKNFTDGAGRETKYTRTLYGNPSQITIPFDGDNKKQIWTRDSLDLPLSYKDELLRVTNYIRDVSHRVTEIDYPDGTSEHFSYNNFGEVLTHTLRNGGVESSSYDNRGLRTKFTDALGNVTKYTYDGADRLASVKDARGNITNFEYNERGLLIKVSNPDGSYKAFTYDTFGDQTSITNELGNSWTTNFDEFKRPVKATDPLNRITTYSYDLSNGVSGHTFAYNLPTKITLPSGKVTEIEYDVEWQKISETVGAGTADEATTYYEYDLVGNLVTVVDPRGKLTVNEFNTRNWRVSSTDPLGHVTHWTYDAVGNILTVQRPDGGITVNKYDKMSRITQTTDPKGQLTKFQYDIEGNLIQLTNANKNIYKFNYDLLNRRTQMTYPGGKFEKYTYDPVSNLLTFSNRNGDICTYIYDARNRQTNFTWSDGTPAVNRTYDIASRPLTIVSSVSAVTYTYDNANEILSETQAITNNGTKVLSYTYNTDGLEQQLTYPGGSIINYDYTARNQISSVSVNGTTLVTYTYDANGNRLTKVLENGTNSNYTWDDANRLTTSDNLNSSGSFARFVYGYDNVNRRTYVMRNNGKGDVFKYDAIDQVTNVQYEATNPATNPINPVRTVNYVLDPLGNRDTVIDNSIPTAYSVNNKNLYTSIGSSTLSYSANADLSNYNGWAYTYDAQNRLTQAKKGDTTVKFSYDPLNRCVKRTINGTATFFYYDGWTLLEERDINNVQLARYMNGAGMDEILERVASGTDIYYHHDAIGNVVRLTDDNGNVVEQYAYDVFGAPTIKDASGNIITSSAYANRFLFTGTEFIKEIGLYDYRNRFYSSDLGRFLQPDPSGFKGGDINLYRYVGNNVVNWIDPIGLSSKPTPDAPQTTPPPNEPPPPSIPATPVDPNAIDANDQSKQTGQSKNDKSSDEFGAGVKVTDTDSNSPGTKPGQTNNTESQTITGSANWTHNFNENVSGSVDYSHAHTDTYSPGGHTSSDSDTIGVSFKIKIPHS